MASFCAEYASATRAFHQYTPSQLLLIDDVKQRDYYPDKVTCFGLRPPELLHVCYLSLYLEWFIWVPLRCDEAVVHDTIEEILQSGMWLDGLDRITKLRLNAVVSFSNFIQAVLNGDHGSFHPLLHVYWERTLLPLSLEPLQFTNYVDISPPILIQIVPKFILPDMSIRWLTHLILYYGRYTCEIEVFSAATLLDAFERVGLYNSDNRERSVLQLLDSWAMRELRAMPGPQRRFDYHLRSARYILHCLMVTDNHEIQFLDTPLILLRQLQEAHTVELRELILKNRERFCRALSEFKFDDLPSTELLQYAELQTPVRWHPTISLSPGTDPASLSEQRLALDHCLAAISAFRSGNKSFIPFPLLLGSPGTGKSFVAMLSLAVARSFGLETVTVALSSETAQRYGGQHLHRLFNLVVVRHGSYLTTTELISQSVQRLRRSPLHTAYLLSIDIFLIEEIGLVDETTFLILDSILRELRDSRLPWAGSLVIGTGDYRQLSPISGPPLWTSNYLISHFSAFILRHYVRSASDMVLQRVIDILRKDSDEITDYDITYVSDAIIHRCKLCCSIEEARSLAGVGICEVYSQKRSERAAVQRFFTYLQSCAACGQRVFESSAEDEYNEGGLHARWRSAGTRYSKILDAHVMEPATLKIKEGSILRLTRNDLSADNVYSQGQICICTKLPDSPEDVLHLRVAPPGARFISHVDQPLLSSGWKDVTIRKEVGFEISARGVLLRRRQYGVKNFVSQTIHKSLGDTLPGIITKISYSGGDPMQKEFTLWERQQLLVLISRVPSLDRIIFINTADEIKSTVQYLLKQTSSWTSYATRVIEAMSSSLLCRRPCKLIYSRLNSLPLRVVPLPRRPGGFVYSLISTRLTLYSYVGSCKSIRRRLDQHNRGLKGSVHTCSTYVRPFAVAGLIMGFPHSDIDSTVARDARLELEQAWHSTIRRSDSPQNVLDKGYNIMLSFRSRYPDLIFINYYTTRLR